MTIRREGPFLTAERSAHCAYEVVPGRFRVSMCPGVRVSAKAAVAALVIAEMSAKWGKGLWADTPHTRMVWGLIEMQARTVGMNPLDLVLRCQAGEVPADAAVLGVSA
ncbi:hypothetical protein [Nocardia cyriacigeorgica]|uniref:hypothetical protein n=1 Tax=Nocardia cyriacigeorgica TaxID=135487 RepID=UPI00189446E1|nr:hypothetical protein [Nocardia cyriacigeorgica]MBF6163002.1 hypothetical protein [Nocardia cyriacigeorgica]MBF6201981.1 hypothetical protein [Nocardia cyriacigeorgica]